MRRRWRRCEGQAANEYVALLAIVAVVLISAVGLTTGGIGGEVLAGVRAGLCTVTGTTCPARPPTRADLPACPLERQFREERLSETIGVVKLGTQGMLTAVRHSDGRVTVTLADGSALGGDVGIGARLALGGTELGAERRGTLEAIWSSGRSWSFPDTGAAAAFVERYGAKATIGGKLVDQVRSRCSILCDLVGWRPHAELPPPDETHQEGGVLGRLTAQLGLGERGSQTAEGAIVLGTRTARDGARTWYLKLPASASAQLRIPAGGLTGAIGGAAVLAYHLDARGRPLRLGVTVAAEGSGRAALSPGAERGAVRGRGGGDLDRGGLVELDASLDLTDPDNLASATALADAFTGGRPATEIGARLAALGGRIADHGQIDLRAFELSRSGSSFGGALALGVKLGGSFDRSSRELRLVEALTRLPGLPFLARHDCLSA